MDIWQYIKLENIELRIFLSPARCLCATVIMGEFIELPEEETVETMTVRFRTIGDATCTGAALSTEQSRRHHRRSGGCPSDRARYACGRQALRSSHGRPQEAGLLLSTAGNQNTIVHLTQF